jgi:hypothetical protein
VSDELREPGELYEMVYGYYETWSCLGIVVATDGDERYVLRSHEFVVTGPYLHSGAVLWRPSNGA